MVTAAMATETAEKVIELAAETFPVVEPRLPVVEVEEVPRLPVVAFLPVVEEVVASVPRVIVGRKLDGVTEAPVVEEEEAEVEVVVVVVGLDGDMEAVGVVEATQLSNSTTKASASDSETLDQVLLM